LSQCQKVEVQQRDSPRQEHGAKEAQVGPSQRHPFILQEAEVQQRDPPRQEHAIKEAQVGPRQRRLLIYSPRRDYLRLNSSFKRAE
jgi:hypothetical protein